MGNDKLNGDAMFVITHPIREFAFARFPEIINNFFIWSFAEQFCVERWQIENHANGYVLISNDRL